MDLERLAGVQLRALNCGALWWEQARLLVVSDLHLEKASSYAARGQMLPPYDTRATLALAATLKESVQAHQAAVEALTAGGGQNGATANAAGTANAQSNDSNEIMNRVNRMEESLRRITEMLKQLEK